MFLPLRTRLIYEIRYIDDCRTFLQSLPIGCGENQTFVFAGLESSHSANRVLEQHSLPADQFVTNALQSVKDEDFPNAVVYKVRYSRQLTSELLGAIGPEDNPTAFCRHIVGFLGMEPWFSFHDAFGDVMQVSGDCTESEVTRIAVTNNADYQLVKNPCT